MISLESAKDILFDEIERLGLCLKEVETVPLWEVGGRVLAENIVAGKMSPLLIVHLLTDMPSGHRIHSTQRRIVP